jgi:hypothetical protein
MDIETLRKWITERDSFSMLETVDVFTGVRNMLKEFDYVIEAPNWTRDGRTLVYNSRGRMYAYSLETGAIQDISRTTMPLRGFTSCLWRAANPGW